MNQWERAAVAVALLAFASVPVVSAEVRDYAVELSAEIDVSASWIHLTWPRIPLADRYHLFRKAPEDTIWGPARAVLDGDIAYYLDTDVEPGHSYEYGVQLTPATIIDTVAVAHGTPVRFTIRDSWGDGICCAHGHGSYELWGCGHRYAQGGEFGAIEVVSFVTGSLGGPCDSLIVMVTPDVYGTEATWTLVDESDETLLAEGGALRCAAPWDDPGRLGRRHPSRIAARCSSWWRRPWPHP